MWLRKLLILRNLLPIISLFSQILGIRIDWLEFGAFDTNKTGSGTGMGALLALCSGLLEKNLKGGLVVVGGLNLGGSIETIFNPVAVAEAAADKGARMVLMPVTSRRQLVDLPDEVATRVSIIFYADAKDALIKALG